MTDLAIPTGGRTGTAPSIPILVFASPVHNLLPTLYNG